MKLLSPQDHITILKKLQNLLARSSKIEDIEAKAINYIIEMIIKHLEKK